MATNTAFSSVQETSWVEGIKNGVIAGLVGGLAFGIMMGLQGMLSMVGMLVGVDNAIVGFIVHMLNSAFIGAVFGIIASRLPLNWGIQIGAGAIYGVIWWVLGALFLMPLMLGMTDMVFVIGQMQWMSLIGHLIFGVVTALVFVPLNKR